MLPVSKVLEGWRSCARLEKLLDLYLVGDFPQDMLTERKARLEATIAALEKEQGTLTSQLEAEALTDQQIQTIEEFAARTADGLDVADADFGARRRIIEILDVQATLTVEDGQKVAYAQCILGKDVLSIASVTS